MTTDATDEGKATAGHLTIGAIQNALNHLKSEGGIFAPSYGGLVKAFLAEFVGKAVFCMNFSELRECCRSLGAIDRDAPVEPEPFFRWFCDEVLRLSRLPSHALSELYSDASRDLAVIKDNLRKCDEGAAAVKKRNPKTDRDGLDEKLFQYFHDRNLEARDEIVNVLANGIEDEAVYASRRRPFVVMDFHVPWSFRWFSDRFDPDSFSEIRHKFGRLPLDMLKCRGSVQLESPGVREDSSGIFCEQ